MSRTEEGSLFLSPEEILPKGVFLKQPELSIAITPDRISKICAAIPLDQVVEAMTTCGLPPERAVGIARGELGRIAMFGPLLWDHFYGKPLCYLKDHGHIPASYSAAELGPSWGSHWAALDPSLHPTAVIGLDKAPHIAAAAEVTVKALKQKELLSPETNIDIRKGDETTPLSWVDVRIASLLSLYVPLEKTIDWLTTNTRVGINGDACSGLFPATEEEITQGLVPIRSSLPSGRIIDTGVALRLEEIPGEKETVFGKVYRSSLLLSKQVYGENGLVEQISLPDGSYESTATLVKGKDGFYVRPWVYQITGASDNEVEQIAAIVDTFDDIFSGMADKNWNPLAGCCIPIVANERKDDSIDVKVMITMPGDAPPGSIPAIVLRNSQELPGLSAEGKLRHVGQGKLFNTPGELIAAAAYWLSPQSEMRNKFKVKFPPICTTLIIR